MRYSIIQVIFIIICVVFVIPQSATAHCTRWNELYEQVMLLYTQNQSEQAITTANDAVVVAENRFGTEHPYVALSLNNLAQLYFETGQYALAEPLYTRALDIYEKSMGPESLNVAHILTNLSGLYLKMDKIEEALSCLSRVQNIYSTIYKTNIIEIPR